MGSHHTITARQDRVREFVSPIVIERVHPLEMQHTSTHKPPQKKYKQAIRKCKTMRGNNSGNNSFIFDSMGSHGGIASEGNYRKPLGRLIWRPNVEPSPL